MTKRGWTLVDKKTEKIVVIDPYYVDVSDIYFSSIRKDMVSIKNDNEKVVRARLTWGEKEKKK